MDYAQSEVGPKEVKWSGFPEGEFRVKDGQKIMVKKKVRIIVVAE